MQEHDGALNFATDAWTSLNHKAYVAVTVQFENDRVSVSMLLNSVKLAYSHSGSNLAAAFAKILEDFVIRDKVSKVTLKAIGVELPGHAIYSRSPAIMRQTMTQ